MLEEGFNAFVEGPLQKLLKRMTDKLYKSLGLGFVVTIFLQSSSAAMALILTALAVGQITYENSLALAIGANIGTTITAILGSLNANVAGKRLERLKEKANKSDVLVHGTLDKLIREQKISSVMATSLANDSDIVADIMKKLIETAELLYINSDTLIGLTKEEKKKEKEEKKESKKLGI